MNEYYFMDRILKYLCISVGILFVFFTLSANNQFPEQIRFKYITTKEGLPQNTVDCIIKDSKGFMWFGTWNGLCRYDGYSFRINQKQTHKLLPGNFIHSLCEDAEGNIWIGTNEGLTLFNYEKFKFEYLETLQLNVGRFCINHLIKVGKDTLLVATQANGLWKVEKTMNGEYVAEKQEHPSLKTEHINCLTYLNSNILLVGGNSGLALIAKNENEVPQGLNQLVTLLTGIEIHTIYKDSRNNIWVGTVDVGLYCYQADNHQVRYYGAIPDDSSGLGHLSVTAIIEDYNNNLIVGTLGGINFYDWETKSFSRLPVSTEENKNLNNPFVNSMFADDFGNVWIGTDKGGINYFNSHQKPFYSITHNPADNNTISHNTINSILKEKDIIWVGTAGGGLNKVENGKTKKFRYDNQNPNSINSDFISSIYKDEEKNLWIGTWGGGLNRLRSDTHNIFEILINNSSPTSLCNSYVSCVEKLDKKKLLVGTNNGLDIFDKSNKQFLHVHHKMLLNEDFEVGCIRTTEKYVWVGTRYGLYRFIKEQILNFTYDNDSLQYEKYISSVQDTRSIPGDYIISIHESKQGEMWFGTYGGGICKYIDNGHKGYFERYSEQDGLCNNVAYAIEEDSDGNLWISTDNGLSKFNPETKTFKNFYSSDGLLSNQFYWTASYSYNEVLYFGGINGLNYFQPGHIKSYPIMPKPVFTEFSIFNKPVAIDEKIQSNIVLDKPICETTEITLSYKSAVFSIEFSALNYFLPEKIRYAYKMEGVDQNWVEVPASRRFANYTKLSGGEYIFKVKAAYSDDEWSDKIATLKITILPPFWKKLWFQLMVIFIITVGVMAYIRSRIKFLNEQKRKLENQVRERTHKIEEQKDELEKQNIQIAKQRDEVLELNEKVKLVNQLRLRFFTNISHEFRTPLTLIIDPLEQLISQFKHDKQAQMSLRTINRNAQRLLNLVNQLLYFRRIETGKLTLNVCKGNLVEFLNDIFLSFSDLAFKKNIDYNFLAGANQQEDIWFDSEKVENILYNLLSNAFKYTPEYGAIRLELEFVQSNKSSLIPDPYIKINVNDNGVGISEEHLPKIFDRFYIASPDTKGNYSESSGIGLALTQELVRALHGEIIVKSEIGKGSTFTVYLPYTKEKFEKDEINETSVPLGLNIDSKVNILLEQFASQQNDEESNLHIINDKPKPTVLIVEDNYDLRNFLLQTLKSDYRVLGAENGEIGLSIAKKYSPELIVSDVMMPVMDGMELCSRLKKNIQTSHIPVVLLTAKDMVESWIEGLETGADDYIPKPFNLQILLVKMRNLIEMRRKIKQMFSSPEGISNEKLTNNNIDREFMDKAYSIVEKLYTEDSFNANKFAREMLVSQSLLYKKIKAITNLSITDFINSFKLKKAVELISTSDLTISEIAFQTGFNDPKYFSRIFKKFYGMSPSEFLIDNSK